MNCYDCAQLGHTTPATAVCMHCGAAVCTEHAHITADIIHRFAGMGPTTLPQPARRITCITCHDAEHQGLRDNSVDIAPSPQPTGAGR